MDILITGATGNVGAAVLRALSGRGHRVFAGLRDPARAQLPSGVGPVAVDFTAGVAPDKVFDAIFLMRPPQIADAALFRAFLTPHNRATRVVFLSVQGAETRLYLPHAKIEKAITEMGFAHCYLRPAYFMENLITTLAPDLRRTRQVLLPSGGLKFDWVSVRDIAEVAAAALTGETERQAVTISSGRGLGFDDALGIVNSAAGTQFRYLSASLPGYIRHARRQGLGWSMVAVMLLLHFLPRLTGQSIVPGEAEGVLGRPLETLEEWARRNAAALRAMETSSASQ